MFLGLEIGGTKLQLGIGRGDGSEFVALHRHDVDARRGAAGILEQIEMSGTALLQKHAVERIGIGFGGPVNSATGRVITSHQIAGWNDVQLADWCQRTFGIRTVLGNDCDCAALAEARFGAGKGSRLVFFVTVGTGIGGGLVLAGRLHGTGRPAVAEIGHLRPGLHADRPEETVESLASGPGIVASAQARLSGQVSRPFAHLRRDTKLIDAVHASDLRQRCDQQVDTLTPKIIAQAAAEGNELAHEILDHACQALGWAIAQVVTLIAPEVVVVGGGVSLIGDEFFFAPLRTHAARYVFPPLADSYQIVPAALREQVVVHGALALAAG